LPFSADFRYLGRDLQPAAPGFSTHMRNIGSLGRDLRQAAHRDSLPFSADFRLLGRDFQPTAL
ncbi:MAG TPA: hypothetical protein DCX93_05940, partial [Butyrivibrio sp.]|nr:hypothetical protein [Butyrivibrio sp.]